MNQSSESKSTVGRKASDRVKNFLAATGFALGVLGGGMLIQRDDTPTTDATTAAPALIVTATATSAASTATAPTATAPTATATEDEDTATTVQSQTDGRSSSPSFPGAMTSSRSSR